jgi:hypothetical protein
MNNTKLSKKPTPKPKDKKPLDSFEEFVKRILRVKPEEIKAKKA